MRPLVIIDHDGISCAELCAAVEAAGLRTECVREGAHAVEQLRRRNYSLAILDLDLQDTDPYAVCAQLSRTIPVITLAAEDDEEICLRAFASGADDHLVRPFRGRELVARIRNVLARRDKPDLEPFSVSMSEMRVRAGDAVHDLTRGEAEVLALLLEHAPAPLTAGRIAELLGARRGTVESRIKSLRKKLGSEWMVSRGKLGYQVES